MMTNCPRCLARAAIASPLFSSPLNGGELYAAEHAVAVQEPRAHRLGGRERGSPTELSR